MAAALTAATGESVDLEPGDRGEFTVWVEEEIVAKKSWEGFPETQVVVERVAARL